MEYNLLSLLQLMPALQMGVRTPDRGVRQTGGFRRRNQRPITDAPGNKAVPLRRVDYRHPFAGLVARSMMPMRSPALTKVPVDARDDE